jgi:hypothetical protein
MLLSAVSVLVVAQSSSEIPVGLMNNPVEVHLHKKVNPERVRREMGENDPHGRVARKKALHFGEIGRF